MDGKLQCLVVYEGIREDALVRVRTKSGDEDVKTATSAGRRNMRAMQDLKNKRLK
jgi:hypothetical protein